MQKNYVNLCIEIFWEKKVTATFPSILSFFWKKVRTERQSDRVTELQTDTTKIVTVFSWKSRSNPKP